MKNIIICLFLIVTNFTIFAEGDIINDKPLQARCARIKLKKDTLEETLEWFHTLMIQKEEVLAILKEQGVFVEAVFLDHIGDDYYLIYFMKEEDSKKSVEISSQSSHPLNIGHRQYKKRCWEEKTHLQPLLDLDRIFH